MPSQTATYSDPEPQAATPAPEPSRPAGLRRYLAWGMGAAVEIGERDLRVLAVKVSPGQVDLMGGGVVENFRERPAMEWGAEIARILKKAGAGHVAVTVVLPRSEIIVRHLTLPGVPDKDVPAALGYQVDGLHPYGEGEAAWAWARIPGSAQVLVGMARRETLDHYITLLREAGLKIATVTFSAAVAYSAVRLHGQPAGPFFAMLPAESGGWEIYGESEAHPVYSALFDMPAERVASLARSELRLDPACGEPVDFARLLPVPRRAPEGIELTPVLYSAALAGAAHLFSLKANLLPLEMRASSSRLMYVPTILLALILAGLAVAVPLQQRYEERKYSGLLDREIARYRPQAEAVAKLETQIAASRARIRLLDSFKKHTKADLDALNELTRLLPPPAWINGLDMNRTQVMFGGESEQAVGLLKAIDSSPLFQNSEFAQSLQRTGGANAEVFRIRTLREGQE